MKISLINIGNTREKYLTEGIAVFSKRMERYSPFEIICINEPRNLRSFPEQKQKELEGRLILDAVEKIDHSVLLDVSSKLLNSEEFARFIQQSMNRGTRHLAFITGGPYGFSAEVYQKVNERISISPMTFSHQMIRLIFMEQLYRAFTIIKGEPYHHA